MTQSLPVETDKVGKPTINSCSRILPVFVLWLGAIAVGLLLDRPVADWVHATGLGPAIRGRWYAEILKASGSYWLALVLAAILWWKHPLRWQAAGFMALSGLAGLLNAICKWSVGRLRPFKTSLAGEPLAPFHLEPFRNGLLGMFHQDNLAFPSGHACVAFATATALAMLVPKWRWGFHVVAALVAVERVAENAHYVSDVVAGAAVGTLGVRLISWICNRFVESSKRQMTATSVEHSAG